MGRSHAERAAQIDAREIVLRPAPCVWGVCIHSSLTHTAIELILTPAAQHFA